MQMSYVTAPPGRVEWRSPNCWWKLKVNQYFELAITHTTKQMKHGHSGDIQMMNNNNNDDRLMAFDPGQPG